MIHILSGEWKLPNYPENSYINSLDLYKLIRMRKLNSSKIDITDISHKPLDEIDQKGPRYLEANTTFPCIVCKNMHNPDDKLYRLIDGRHRLLKTINDNKNIIECYILDFADMCRFIQLH